MSSRDAWRTTTHRWDRLVDVDHLRRIRAEPSTYAPTGVGHLILEVLAYAADEARSSGRCGRCLVTYHVDGSFSVSDDGRGTDTRIGADGTPVRKPVMATEDVRFFHGDHDSTLADGVLRRGMSVVAALSVWLEHTNRRFDGAWTQRYEHGMPVGELREIDPGGRGTGTTVRFAPDPQLVPPTRLGPGALAAVATETLEVVVRDETD